MMTKIAGIWPLTRFFRFEKREGIYTTLMMSTGLTFGSISALFGLTNGIISQDQYTILVAAVIGSAVVPTMIAQAWFQPDLCADEESCTRVVEAEEPPTGPLPVLTPVARSENSHGR